MEPLRFADAVIDDLDDLQAVGMNQASTSIGSVGLRQGHQQLVCDRVPLDGASCLKRPGGQGPAL